MPTKNQDKYLDKKEELKKQLGRLGIEKNQKKEEIRKALSFDADQKKNAPQEYTHRVVVEKEARQHINQQFKEKNSELITSIKKLSEEQKSIIKEKINLYQVEEVIKLYKDLGVQEPGVFIIVAQAYEELWQHPTRRNRDNTRKIDKENKDEEQYKNEKAGIIAAELYERVGSKEVYDSHGKTETAYEKAGNIYTRLRMYVKAAESFKKVENREKSAIAYNDAAIQLGNKYRRDAGEMYEKADKIEYAYHQYNKIRLPEDKQEAKKITDKLTELNEKIIKEYEDEGNLRGLAGRYGERGEKQLAAKTYERIEDWERAIMLYDELEQKEKAVEMMKNYNNPEKRAQQMGRRYKKLEQWDDAIEIYKKGNDPYEVLRLYLQQGKVEEANKFFYEYKEERIRKKVKYIYEDNEISAPNGLKKTIMDVRENRKNKLNKANVLMDRDHYKEAIDIYTKLEERKNAGQAALRWAKDRRWSSHEREESKEEIKRIRELAIEMFTKIEDFESIAITQEEIAKALKDEFRSERSNRKDHDKWDTEDEHVKIAIALDNEAKEWYGKALENYRKANEREKVGLMYQEIGERDNAYLTLLNHDIKGERRNVYQRERKDRGREEYLAKNKLLNEKRVNEENEFQFKSSGKFTIKP